MINKIKDFLIVKDDFFKPEVYQEILKDISTLKFQNRYNVVDEKDDRLHNVYQKIYFNVDLNNDHFAVKEVHQQLTSYGLNIGNPNSSYFLSSKHEEITPHNDACDVNCLVYLKGKEIVNSGTGFFEKKEDESLVLNRHIGFKENRAIIFDSKIYHTSLQFNDDAGSRFVMANFIDYKI